MRIRDFRLLVPTLFVALALGRVTPAHAHSDVLDFSTCGTPNDATADNTAALIDALEDRTSTNERMVIYFPAGDWYFQDEVPVNSHSDLSIFDNVTFVGAESAQSAQHQEEGGSNAEKRRSRFVIDLDDESDTWWDQVRAYRFGPLAFRDITFKVVDVGRLFSFGDDTSSPAATLRGLSFERCYFTHPRGILSPDAGGGHAWMYDADGGAGENFVLNTTNQAFSIRLFKCYDVTIRDCSFWGPRYGVINAHGDRVVMDNVRGLGIGKLLDEYNLDSLSTGAAVGSHIDNLFAENAIFAGAVITGQAGKVRSEFGYNSAGSLATVPVGPYELPSDVDWAIPAGSATVNFTFPGGWGFDCTDYFEPRMVIRVNPIEADEPDRFLYVRSVSTNSVTFANSTSISYVSRALSGDGAGVTRFFGTGCIADGDRAAVLEPSLGLNEDTDDLPIAFIVPQRRPIRFGANIETSGPDPDDASNLPVVVASSAGVQFSLHAGVDWLGSNDPPNHPLVNLGGVGPKYDPNVREAVFDPFSETQLFLPGRGVAAANNCARDLTFHKINDSSIKQDVWCYRTTDAPSVGWQLRNLRKEDQPVRGKVRAFVASGTPNLNVYGGEGFATQVPLVSGWQTECFELDDTQVDGDVISIGGPGIYVAWVQLNQECEECSLCDPCPCPEPGE
jgi:hypothetical protein